MSDPDLAVTHLLAFQWITREIEKGNKPRCICCKMRWTADRKTPVPLVAIAVLCAPLRHATEDEILAQLVGGPSTTIDMMAAELNAIVSGICERCIDPPCTLSNRVNAAYSLLRPDMFAITATKVAPSTNRLQ